MVMIMEIDGPWSGRYVTQGHGQGDRWSRVMIREIDGPGAW